VFLTSTYLLQSNVWPASDMSAGLAKQTDNRIFKTFQEFMMQLTFLKGLYNIPKARPRREDEHIEALL